MWPAVQIVVLVATSTAASSGPGEPNLRPSDTALAGFPPIVPLVSAEGTTFRMVTIVPIVTERGTTLHAANDPDDEPSGSTIRIVSAPPPVRAERSEPYVAAPHPPPTAVVVPPPASPPSVRAPVSLGVRIEGGFFSPEDINGDIRRRIGSVQTLSTLMGLGLTAEYRPWPVFGISGTASWSAAPPASSVGTSLFFHTAAASAAARLYVPTVETVDVAMGAELSVRWAGYDGRSGVGAGFVWRFGIQLREKGLPIVLATLFFRRAKVTVDRFELDSSGIGLLTDFLFDL